MAVNIVKLCVGADSIKDLQNWQKMRFALQKNAMHVTRQWPKRAEEVLDGGSIYWVINGYISVRQKIVGFKEVDKNGIPSCGLVLDKKLIRVQPRPRKAFQGWRYYDPKDAPPDLKVKDAKVNDKMMRELAELGLL